MRGWKSGVAIALAAGSVVAQPRPDLPQVPEPAPPPASIDLRVPPPARAVELAAPVTVRVFRVVGATSIDAAELQGILTPWVGRPIGSAELEQAVNALRTALRSRGLLVADAFVPAQEMTDGVLTVVVTEGRIGRVRVERAPDLRLRPGTVDAFLSAIQPGAPIRRDNVEHRLLLLNDLPGAKVSGSIVPGSELGTTDLLLDIENEPRIAGRIGFDNAGMRGLGELRAIGELRFPGALGYGDQLTARLMQTAEGGRQTLASATYGLPVNGYGTRVGVRYVEQRYRVGREFAALRANGENRAFSLLASHPLRRRSDHNLGVEASYSEASYHDRQDAVSFSSASRQRFGAFAVTFDERDAWLGGGASALRLQLLSGEAILETPILAALDASPGGLGVAGRFHVLRMSADRRQVLGGATDILLSLRGQLASKNLEPGTELTVAGPNAVRALPTGELFADQGFIARADLRRVFSIFDAGPTLGRLFVDAARVETNRNAIAGDPANVRKVSGYGIALDQSLRQSVVLQVSLAWQASGREPRTAPPRDPRVWASATVHF
jgi:hemolysin activation/secretion protein